MLVIIGRRKPDYSHKSRNLRQSLTGNGGWSVEAW